MLGKFAITISFCVVYVVTAEMFPTKVRQSMVSYGSTFGRVGSMLAPQTPLLVSLVVSVPRGNKTTGAPARHPWPRFSFRRPSTNPCR